MDEGEELVREGRGAGVGERGRPGTSDRTGNSPGARTASSSGGGLSATASDGGTSAPAQGAMRSVRRDSAGAARGSGAGVLMLHGGGLGRLREDARHSRQRGQSRARTPFIFLVYFPFPARRPRFPASSCAKGLGSLAVGSRRRKRWPLAGCGLRATRVLHVAALHRPRRGA